ncbi:hypothetical protein LEMLEM_LOCUS12904 [Lemmus lemmus]
MDVLETDQSFFLGCRKEIKRAQECLHKGGLQPGCSLQGGTSSPRLWFFLAYTDWRKEMNCENPGLCLLSTGVTLCRERVCLGLILRCLKLVTEYCFLG